VEHQGNYEETTIMTTQNETVELIQELHIGQVEIIELRENDEVDQNFQPTSGEADKVQLGSYSRFKWCQT